MTRSSKTRRARRRKHAKSDAAAPNRDGAVYGSLILIGLFVTALGFLLSGGHYWAHTAIGFVTLMVVLINAFATRAFMGGRLMAWQQSLARVPLRPAGYGRKGGKPLEAAHGQSDARSALITGVVVSLLVVFGGVILLFPGLVGLE